MPIANEAKTHKDYRVYVANLEPRDFTRVHDADLKALREVIRDCYKDARSRRTPLVDRLFGLLNYDEPS